MAAHISMNTLMIDRSVSVVTGYHDMEPIQ